MTYEEAIGRFSEDERRQIDERLRILADHSALGLQARMNLRIESRLPPDAWEALFRALLAVGTDPQTIKMSITQSLRSWTLQAPEIPPPRPAVFGRAVTLYRICKMLVDRGDFGTIDRAEKSVRRLLSQLPGTVPPVWRKRSLGQFLMWSTFHPDRTSSPFDGLPVEADAIRAHLGLLLAERGQPLLLLEYSVPPDVPLRYPTVAEAYAGDDWSYFFRPPLADDPHGKTLPWPEPAEMTPRPEVVHVVIRGDQLTGGRVCP